MKTDEEIDKAALAQYPIYYGENGDEPATDDYTEDRQGFVKGAIWYRKELQSSQSLKTEEQIREEAQEKLIYLIKTQSKHQFVDGYLLGHQSSQSLMEAEIKGLKKRIELYEKSVVSTSHNMESEIERRVEEKMKEYQEGLIEKIDRLKDHFTKKQDNSTIYKGMVDVTFGYTECAKYVIELINKK